MFLPVYLHHVTTSEQIASQGDVGSLLARHGLSGHRDGQESKSSSCQKGKGKFARLINAATIVCYSPPHSCPGLTLTFPIVTVPEIPV